MLRSRVHCHRVVFRYLGVDLPFDSEDLLVLHEYQITALDFYSVALHRNQ